MFRTQLRSNSLTLHLWHTSLTGNFVFFLLYISVVCTCLLHNNARAVRDLARAEGATTASDQYSFYLWWLLSWPCSVWCGRQQLVCVWCKRLCIRHATFGRAYWNSMSGVTSWWRTRRTCRTGNLRPIVRIRLYYPSNRQERRRCETSVCWFSWKQVLVFSGTWQLPQP
jgi:hypothetical protein